MAIFIAGLLFDVFVVAASIATLDHFHATPYKINSDQGLCSFSLSFSPVIFKITYSGRSIPLSSYYSTAYQSDWIWSKDAQLSSTVWLRPPIPGQKRQRILDSDPPTSKKWTRTFKFAKLTKYTSRTVVPCICQSIHSTLKVSEWTIATTMYHKLLVRCLFFSLFSSNFKLHDFIQITVLELLEMRNF